MALDRGAADHDADAEQREETGDKRRPVPVKAEPQPAETGGQERRRGEDHGDVGHRGAAQRVDVEEGGGGRAYRGRQARAADGLDGGDRCGVAPAR